MISLLSFVQTGRLGSIGLESPRAEVERAFGLPEAWDAENQRTHARIWKYGDIEIYLEKDLVWMIFADEFNIPHMGTIPFDACGIHGSMTVPHMEQWLLTNNLTFNRTAFPYCDEGVRFETTSGVTFTFCAENQGEIAFLRSFCVLRR